MYNNLQSIYIEQVVVLFFNIPYFQYIVKIGTS